MGARTLLFLVFASTLSAFLSTEAAATTKAATITTTATTTTAAALLKPDSFTVRSSYDVFENTAIGSVLFNFTASYSQNSHPKLNVTPEGDSAKYVKVNKTADVWNVILNATLDREEEDIIPLTLLLAEGTDTLRVNTTLHVLDANDNPPVFSNSSYTATIRENSPAGTALTFGPGLYITVSDKDQGKNSLMTLKLEGAEDAFELGMKHIQSEGLVVILVKNQSWIDYERSSQLTFEIVATDSPVDGQNNSANATVTVNIEPVNEYAPEFNNSNNNFSVPEGSPVGYLVVNITAFDRDGGGADGNITFSLLGDQGMFRIDPVSGVVTVSSNKTDREAQDKYVLLVQAQDGGGLVSITSLTITIDDVNDNPPIFHRDLYKGILKENSMNFSQPIRLNATDSDQPLTQNSNITYSLSTSTPSGLDSYFHIDPLTGELTVVQPLDFDNISFSAEQPGTIILTAIATDNGSSPLNSTVLVVITLLDENDNAREFQNLTYYGTVLENASVGTQVVTVRTRDKNGTAPNNQVFYFIETGGRDQFAINHTTGVISVQSKLDRETVSHYSLRVVARDQGAEPLSSYCNVSIEVGDVNDELPTFGEKRHVVTDISENTFGAIYDMSAEDPDHDKSLQYSILWGESHGQTGLSTQIPEENLQTLVKIDSHNGMVSSVAPFDSSQVRRLELTVMVEDTNAFEPRPQQDTATLTIIVTERLRSRRSALVPEINNFKVDSPLKSQGDNKLDTKVAFAAGLTHQVEMSESQRVVYDRIFMNHGSAYNNRTGTFTCPQSGLYTFEVHTSAPRDSSGRLSLHHNDNSVMTVVAKAEKRSAAKGNSVVLQLSKGDDVYVTSTPGLKIQLLGAPHLILNTFSGYLISPDLEGVLRKGN